MDLVHASNRVTVLTSTDRKDMPQNAPFGSTRAVEYGWVTLYIEAYLGWLVLTVTVKDSALTLPEDHPQVHTSESDALPGIAGLRQYRHFQSPASSLGRYQATEVVGEHFEIGAYTALGDRYDNPITADLLACFATDDRKRIVYALDKLAAYRNLWWIRALAKRAESLKKEVGELTNADLGRLMTRSGYRNYPLFGQTPAYDASPTFRVNRHHLETELQLLLNCLLNDAAVAP